jgi:hypothetical protein
MTTTTTLLEVARRYFELGLQVIPCHTVEDGICTCRAGKDCVSPGKHPAIPWQRFQKHKIDEAQLDIWFGDGAMYSNKNIGIVTGSISGNVFVVDVDIGQGKLGDESLEELQLANDDLPITLESKTGGGGRQFFFRAPAGMEIVTDKNVLGPGIDTRGEGGFVVAPPSLHKSGRRYVMDWEPIEDAPGWLLDMVQVGAIHDGHGRGIQDSSASDNPFKAGDGREGVMVRVILSTITSYWREHQALPDLDTLIDLGYPNYVEKVKAREATLDAENRGIKLFTQRASYQLNRARRNELRVLAKAKEEQALEVRSHGTIAQALTRDEFDEFDEPSETTAIKIDSQSLELSDWAIKRFVGEPPEIDWLIEGVIPHGIPALLAAIGGLGKSFLLLDLAMKVAGGGTAWDDEMQMAFGGKVSKFGKVVFLTAEDSASSVHRRLDSMDHSELRAKAAENLIVVPLPDAGGAFPFITADSTGLHHTAGYIELRNQLLELGNVQLVIFDPLQAFVHADVTADPAAAQFWWSTMSELCAVLNATVVVAHHMRKDGAFSIKHASDARQAIRGTTALVDGARLVYSLWSLPEQEDEEISRLLEVEPGQSNVACGAVVKTNEFADMHIRTFKRSDGGLLVDVTGEVEQLMADASSISRSQENAIFEEIEKRWSNGDPFNPNPRARSHSFVYWLSQTYGLPKRIAEGRMHGWMSSGRLVAKTHDVAKRPGLRMHEQQQEAQRYV